LNRTARFALALLVMSPGAGRGIAADTIRIHFESDAAGSPPSFLRFESSEGLSATGWRVEPSDNPVTTPNVAIQTDPAGKAGQYRFALSSEARDFRDGDVQASLQCRTAKSPCRSGVVLRYKDPRNFAAAVYDFAKSVVTVFTVRKGKTEILGSAPFESLERFWTTVAVEANGGELTVKVSGRSVLAAKDPHPREGAAGLLSEAGSLQAFDDLILSPR